MKKSLIITLVVFGLMLTSFAFGAIVSDDFENNDDGRFRSANASLDFSLPAEMVINIELNNWFYCWDEVHNASPAYSPAPTYDFTGATITYESMWELDLEGGARDYSNQVLNHRIYSGYYDDVAQAWVLEGFQDFQETAPVSGDNGIWYAREFVEGEGTVTDYAGDGFDPSKVYYWRWYGTDWDWDNNTDEVHLRNYEANVTVPEPGTFMLIGSGLAGLFFLRRKK